MSAAEAFLAARDFLRAHRDDYEAAYKGFSWPSLDQFNWGTDYFDGYAEGNHRVALLVADESGQETRLSFAEMRDRSNQAANFLLRLGIKRTDHVLVMLDNIAPLWEIMLGCIKLGAVMIPASTLLTVTDLEDRLRRGEVACVITDPTNAKKFDGLAGSYVRVVVGQEAPGFTPYDQ